MIDTDCLRSNLKCKRLAARIVYNEATESTNSDAKTLIRNGACDGTLMICSVQTHGRGRRDHIWLSNAEDSLCMSLIIKPKIDLCLAPRYTIATAAGVCEAIQSLGADAGIKWPNDILCGGKKLCGILLEAIGEYVIIGIGVNVAQKKFDAQIAQRATSLALAGVRNVTRESAAVQLINSLEKYYAILESENGFDMLMPVYKKMSLTLNQRVNIISVSETITGKVVGFDELGRIILEKEDGEIFVINEGDVSLRNVNESAD